jgi:hypothetical protein
MRRTRPAPPAVVFALLLSLIPPPPVAHAVAPSDSAPSALDRLRSAYEARDASAYAAVFTPDFRFHFGDAEGRAAHPGGWGREEEALSARHLFEGFVDRTGVPRPAARAIALDLGHLVAGPDPEFPCDPDHHVLVDAANVTLTIDFGGGRTVARGHHAFWLARADSGDTLEWRVRRWVEEPEEALLVVQPEPPACVDSQAVALSPVPLVTDEPVRLWTVAPNPSRRGTTATLSFDVPREGDLVEAALYDIAGRRVAVLAEGPSAAGRRTLAWDGRNVQGEATGAGIYFLRVRVGEVVRRDRVVRIP